MSNPTITIHDLETNEVIQREMNDEELAQWRADQARSAAQIVTLANKERERQDLLTKLGITADEANLLLG